jgi:hypothetical protein
MPGWLGSTCSWLGTLEQRELEMEGLVSPLVEQYGFLGGFYKRSV